MRVCLLTRGDLFPTCHGAAVKIVRTAEALAAATGGPCAVVTDDRDRYLRVDAGGWSEHPYSPRVRAAEEWPGVAALGRRAAGLVARLGYPPEEAFLYTPMFDPAWVLRALDVGRREGTTVFQAEFPGYGPAAAAAARLLSSARRLRAAQGRPAGPVAVRASIVQHNVEWDRLEEFGHDVRWVRRAERAALAAVDDVIAVSLDDKRRMVAAGLPAGAVTVIPHGVALGDFQGAPAAGVRAHWGIPADAPLLFFHGTLHYWPNTEAVRFIAERLLPRLRARRPGLHVLVGGMSPPRYYATEGLVFTDRLDALGPPIAAADLCICPITAGGGTRMKLLEYMAAGKAVVSTRKGAEGIQHSDGENIVLADGVEAFADAVLALLDDPARRARVGAAAARFAARFDWSRIGAAYTALYGGTGRGEDWNLRLADPAVAPAPRPVVAAPSPLPADEPEIAAHLPPRAPSKPRTMLLLLNRGCNLRCSFCDLWEGHVHMPVAERVLPLLDQARAIDTRTVVFTGGEPFLHPGLFDAVAGARARGMGVNITTNGTLVDKHWDALQACPPDALSFSIDGLAPTHDRLRGQKGAWTRTMRALGRVLDAGTMGASVYFTVTNENVDQLLAVWEQVRAMGAGFDFWPVNDAPELALRSPEDRARFREAVATIGAVDPAVAARSAYYEDGLAYHADGGAPRPVRCLGLVDQYGVTFDGRFLPCCVWGGEGLALGNVFETPLDVLWRAPEVQAFRRRMFHEGCDAGCFNHSLYEFTASTGLPAAVDRSGAGAPAGPAAQ